MRIVRRIAVIAAAMALMLAVAAGPASAHMNAAAGKFVGVPGPVQDHVVEVGGLGHIGMECGVRDNTPLETAGLTCPAD